MVTYGPSHGGPFIMAVYGQLVTACSPSTMATCSPTHGGPCPDTVATSWLPTPNPMMATSSQPTPISWLPTLVVQLLVAPSWLPTPNSWWPLFHCPHPTHGGHLLVAYTQLHDGHFFAAHTLLMATNSHWPRTGCPMLVAHTHLMVATPCCPPPAPLCVPTAGLGLLGVTPEPTAEGSRDTTPTATIGVSTALRDEAEGQPGHSPTGVGCGVGVTL